MDKIEAIDAILYWLKNPIMGKVAIDYEATAEQVMINMEQYFEPPPDSSRLLGEKRVVEIITDTEKELKHESLLFDVDMRLIRPVLEGQRDLTAEIKNARYKQAVKDERAGEPLDLTSEEFEIYSSIVNQATRREYDLSLARTEALIGEIDNCRMKTDLHEEDGPLVVSKGTVIMQGAWWEKLKATYTKGDEG